MADVATARPPFWRDVRVIRVAAQVGTLIAAGLLLRWLFDNLATNIDEQGIPSPFDIDEWRALANKPAGFAVRDSSFDPESPLWKLILVGIQNTAAVAVVGITFALTLGTLIGVGRLSSNWVVRKVSTLYVETFRNIPVLVIIIFFWQSLFTFGPFPLFNPTNPPGTIQVPGSDSNLLIYSKSRWGFPSIANEANGGTFWIVMLVGVVVAAIVWRWRTTVNERTGAPHRRVLWSIGALVIIAVVAFIALGGPIRWSFPAVGETGRTIVGGIATNDAYIALTLALGIYTASHIAEIVRGSILAVPKGQNEAANALALTGFQRYRFVVLPQAFRIAIPPIINQFLNLVKNSSLAIAVAYPEITALVKTAIGNGNPATQLIAVLMACYLLFSLFISLVLNIVNRRLQLAGR